MRNAQGDVTHIINTSGTVIAQYTYDTWGKLISIKDGNGYNELDNKYRIYVNAGNIFGMDYCFDPTRSYELTTKATSVTFGSGIGFGMGYDYYLSPLIILRWGVKLIDYNSTIKSTFGRIVYFH